MRGLHCHQLTNQRLRADMLICSPAPTERTQHSVTFITSDIKPSNIIYIPTARLGNTVHIDFNRFIKASQKVLVHMLSGIPGCQFKLQMGSQKPSQFPELLHQKHF